MSTEQGAKPVSLYKVHFKWNDKDVDLTARSLDLTHPYFVSIKDIIFPDNASLIINPSQDEIRKNFGKANHLMIPFQTVALIEEYKDEEVAKVMPFSVVEDNPTEHP